MDWKAAFGKTMIIFLLILTSCLPEKHRGRFMEIRPNEVEWQEIFEGSTIGYKRLIRLDPVKTSRVRLAVLEANNRAAISNIGLYKASERE